MVLLHDLKNFLKEISITEIKHLDPVRVRIYIQGLIDSEERRMTDYKTGVMPSLVKELNDLLDLVNDIEADRDEWKVKYNDSTGKLQRDDLFDIGHSGPDNWVGKKNKEVINKQGVTELFLLLF